MYEGCEKRLDVNFVCTDANAPGLCTLPFALWEAVARAAGAEILSQVRRCYVDCRNVRTCMQRRCCARVGHMRAYLVVCTPLLCRLP